MQGYNDQTRVTLYREVKAKDVVIPDACITEAMAPKGTENKDKWVKIQRAKLWKEAIAAATVLEKVETFDIDVASHRQSKQVTKPAVMETHTPLVVKAKDVFNRKYAEVRLNAQGLQTAPAGTDSRQVNDRGRRLTQTGTKQKSGTFVPAYDVKANTNLNNVYLTPAYVRADKVSVVKLLGLKAFPAGTTVTVTNVNAEGEGAPAEVHTRSFVAKKGSGSLHLRAMQNARLRITVSYPVVKDKAQGSSYTFETRVPMASGKPVIAKRGMRYYRINAL
jgi:hypothetical protein